MPRFEKEIPIAKVTNMFGCLDSSDEVIKEVARQTGISAEIEYWMKAASLPRPVPQTKYKVDWRKTESESYFTRGTRDR